MNSQVGPSRGGGRGKPVKTVRQTVQPYERRLLPQRPRAVWGADANQKHSNTPTIASDESGSGVTNGMNETADAANGNDGLRGITIGSRIEVGDKNLPRPTPTANAQRLDQNVVHDPVPLDSTTCTAADSSPSVNGGRNTGARPLGAIDNNHNGREETDESRLAVILKAVNSSIDLDHHGSSFIPRNCLPTLNLQMVNVKLPYMLASLLPASGASLTLPLRSDPLFRRSADLASKVLVGKVVDIIKCSGASPYAAWTLSSEGLAIANDVQNDGIVELRVWQSDPDMFVYGQVPWAKANIALGDFLVAIGDFDLSRGCARVDVLAEAKKSLLLFAVSEITLQVAATHMQMCRELLDPFTLLYGILNSKLNGNKHW